MLSLRRLKRDQIDLYQLHQVDPAVQFEDQVGTLADLKEEGKIAAVGLNEVSVEQLVAARQIVDIASVQNRYSLTERKPEDVPTYCRREGLPFIAWFPLNVGALTRPTGLMGDVSARVGATPAQVALAWLLAHADNLVPIPGTGSIAHLEENAVAATVHLDAFTMAELDARAA